MPSMSFPDKTPQNFRKGPQSRRVLYPMLPSILDQDSLSAISTLESEEIDFARRQGLRRNQYLHALYLKAMATLGHSHVQPKDLPRRFRQRIAEQLDLEADFVRILSIERREKSRIVTVVRGFLGLAPVSRKEMDSVLRWLQNGPAKKENDVAVLINAAIEWFKSRAVELPAWDALQRLVQRALSQATVTAIKAIDQSLGADDGERLDALLSNKDGRTLFDFLKNPVPQATANNLAKELIRIERLRSFFPKQTPLAAITRHQQEQLARLARRYTAAEVAQLSRTRRRALLLCFVADRHAFLLDAAADMIIRIWEHTKHGAGEYANARQQAMASAYEAHQNVLSALLSMIKTSRGPEELWLSVHEYKSPQEYEGILSSLECTPSWNASYVGKIEDHCAALRRFLPGWYRLIPLCATTADDSLARAHAFAGKYAASNQTELPVEGCPTAFLSPPWENKAVKRYGRTGRIVRVQKAPYEFGLLDATVQGLKNRTVAIAGARSHAPMIDHLLAREQFLANYDEHVRRLGHPATAREHYVPLCAKLDRDLKAFDQDYRATADQFWVNRNGTLGYSRLAGQSPSPRAKRLRAELSQLMPEVSILDLLLDCQRWTGFLDVFKPTSGRQNMTEQERLRHLLAALYAYGCNCSPIQASRALQILKNQIVYMRRRYMPTSSLMEAAAILAHAYQQTSMAERLGDMNVLLTDSMQVRNLPKGLIARQHHRYLSGKSSLLYQHITSNCICLFTQALLCNVSEAIHMLVGVMACRTSNDPLINICDSAGKSNLVFGLSGLLNILLYPRVRSRHLKLWAAGGKVRYKNIASAIAGQVRCDRIDKGWQDIMWILASIEAGTAKPLIILNHLATQPQHPATQGLEELGKLNRSSYLVRYGRDMEMRRFVVPQTSRREHWNKFTGEVQAFGDLIREKTIEDQEEVFWFLTVVQNAIVLWNALSIENILGNGTSNVAPDDLKRILPTMTEHINFIGKFDLDLQRRPSFELKQVIRPR
jgi:TnpA family transposase